MSKFGDKLIESPTEAVSHAPGQKTAITMEDHQRPKRRDRVAFKTEDLSPEQIQAITQSQMDPRHDHLNMMLEQSTESEVLLPSFKGKDND